MNSTLQAIEGYLANKADHGDELAEALHKQLVEDLYIYGVLTVEELLGTYPKLCRKDALKIIAVLNETRNGPYYGADDMPETIQGAALQAGVSLS